MRRFYIEYLGDFVELPLGETIIGRDIGCMLRFNDAAVSRRHLRFVRQQHEVFVEDLSEEEPVASRSRRRCIPRVTATRVSTR